MFAVNTIVNNPWTMVPVYAADYLCGNTVCYTIFGHNFIAYNPLWMGWLNTKIAQYLGLSEISLYSFLIGGNVLGIAFAIMSYPIVRYFFSKVIPPHRAAHKSKASS